MVSDIWDLVPILIYINTQKEEQNRNVGYYSSPYLPSPYLPTTYECKIKMCEQRMPQKRLGLTAS